MASLANVADVVNASLGRIGYKLVVGSLYDGSLAGQQALTIYGQTRDAVLRMSKWGFAEKIAAGILSGNVAPAPWLFEFNYPSDCINVRNLWNSTYTADYNDPLPARWTIGSLATSKVIWSKISGVTLVYTKRVTNPSLWEPGFTELLIDELGKRLAPVLTGPGGAQLADALAGQVAPMAVEIKG